MKNKIITGIALCSLFITGCSLDKAYLNGPNASTFPATKSEVEAGVFATYKGLTLIDASSTPFPGIQDNASDIGASRLNAANYNYQQQSKLPPSNAWVTKVYTQIYKTAARANLVLDGIDNVRELMSEQEYNMYKAELLLVRSFLYDWGCQLYGDIPYIDHTLKLGDTYTRTPKEEVISRILNEDLADEMLDFLPIRHNKNSYGSARLGRAGAYGLKARICLNWKYYEEAAYYADKALKLAEEGGYSLQAYDIRYCGEDHTKGEPTPSNLFGINGHKNSDEWIWALQYNTAISSTMPAIMRRRVSQAAAPTSARRRLSSTPSSARTASRSWNRPCSITRIHGRTATRVSISSAYVRVPAYWACSSRPILPPRPSRTTMTKKKA